MSVDKLYEYAKSVNIAFELSDEQLTKIGQQVLLGYQEDLNSMQEWLSDVERIEELAKLKSVKKSTPLPNSANVKLPVITKACMEFSSRVMPEIVRNGEVVKTRVLGRDDDQSKARQAKNVQDYMNYQLLFQNHDWEIELDMLLMRVGLVGFMCKKTYYDDVRKKITSELCDPKELIINAHITSLEKAPRISHILHWRLNDLVEKKNSESDGVPVFLQKPIEDLIELYKDHSLDPVIDGIEQCTYLDLDEDGYKEPYVITVDKSNGKVFRIVSQYDEEDICVENDKVCYINPVEIYEDYHFFPSPDGKFQSVGFGILLLHLTEAINTTCNQLIDSGQLSNMKGGYMDARLKQIQTGTSGHDPGEFKFLQVQAGASLKDGILPIQFGEPSSVLFQLFNLLLETARDLSSSTQINNGTQSSENAKTGATQSLMQSGEKVFNAINIRIYRSLSKSFRHLFKLDARYLDQKQYYQVLDQDRAVMKEDFDAKAVNVIPVADPNLASAAQRMQEASFVMNLLSEGLPLDKEKATKFILSRTQIPGIMDLLADPNKQQAPDPKLLELQADIEKSGQELNLKGKELELKEKEQLIKAHLAEADIALKEAQSLLAMAQAKSLPVQNELKDLQLQFQAMSKQIDSQLKLADQSHQKDMQAADHTHQQDLQTQQIEAQPNEQEGSSGVSGESGDAGADSPTE